MGQGSVISVPLASGVGPTEAVTGSPHKSLLSWTSPGHLLPISPARPSLAPLSWVACLFRLVLLGCLAFSHTHSSACDAPRPCMTGLSSLQLAAAWPRLFLISSAKLTVPFPVWSGCSYPECSISCAAPKESAYVVVTATI